MQEKTFIKSSDEVIDYLSKNIEENILKRRNLSSSGEIFNSAHLTQCDRRIMYRTSGVAVDEEVNTRPSFKYDEWNYKIAREKWLEIFDSLPNVSIIMRNYTYADCNYNLSGSTDIVKVGRKHVVLEIRREERKDFLDVTINGPKRADVVDIMAKMWLSSIKNGILVYDNTSNGSYQIFHITPYEPLIKSFCKKTVSLMDYKMNGKLPDRNYSDEKSPECISCEYKQKCWKKGENS